MRGTAHYQWEAGEKPNRHRKNRDVSHKSEWIWTIADQVAIGLECALWFSQGDVSDE